MLTRNQTTRAIITAIAVLTALYVLLCYLDTVRTESFTDGTNNGTTNNSINGIKANKLLVLHTLFPSREYQTAIEDTPVIHYNNLDTAITIRVATIGAPEVLENVMVTFHDVKGRKPDITWTTSRWISKFNSTDAKSKLTRRVFEMQQYLEPDTTYRIHIQINGQPLAGASPYPHSLTIGAQHFRAIGVETVPVDRQTDPTHGGPLDGNMGLALLLDPSTAVDAMGGSVSTEPLILPGGNLQLGQIQMIPYNQAMFHIRIPDIRVFHQLVQRNLSKIGGDLPSDAVQSVLAGILEYIPWEINATVVEMTKDGSRPLSEEEQRSGMPRVRIDTSNPSVCVNPETAPTGPCEVRIIGVQPGRYYRVRIQVVFNQLDSTNNYRRTHPLTFQFQAVDITGSASLMVSNPGTGPRGIADTIQEVGLKLDMFKKREKKQDEKLDELDKIYNGISLV